MAAVASYYANPAAADHQLHKARGVRMCDTCGAIEQPGQRFRLCGGCMVTQYCSPQCQKSHWPQHKTICQHTAATVANAKAEAAALPDENVVKNLRRFCSAFETLLRWAVFQALNLKRMPANIRQQALHVQLSFRNTPDPARRFAISRTQIVPRAFIEERDPLVAQDIQRREERCRRTGGIGTAIIMIECAGITQVMPVECDAPSKISWDMRTDWLEILCRYVEAGRIDFKPITTTPNGIIYG